MSDEARDAPSDLTTLTDVLESYAEEGYAATLWVTDDGALRCSECQQDSSPETAKLLSLRRLEGASDPDDMVAVLALQCPNCEARATSVVHFGPSATPAESEVLRDLTDGRGTGDLLGSKARPETDSAP
ncbi:MAG TPA: hypothetical protein VNB24_00820 [Acidimicrobiales bacterium]|nr:hypothetical protein [Acidimicrobiales bacterium]